MKINAEISTDGRTVWVNTTHCIARFCPLSYEALVAEPFGSDVTTVRVSAAVDDWYTFVDLVKARFGVVIEDVHRPDWVK